MSYGKKEKPCEEYRAWKGQEPLCGICAWSESEHEDPRIKEARRLLWEVTNEKRAKVKSQIEQDKCTCGHRRKHHSVPHSINYTGGFCGKCKCLNFIN